MSDVMRDICNSMLAEIQAELGVTYNQLPYTEDILKNNYRSNSNRYGVRALSSSEIPGVTKYQTFTQSFEVVLTKGYGESAIDDSEQVTKAYDNRQNLLAIYKRLVNNRAGVPLVVLNIFDLFVEEPTFIEESKVAVQRATMSITYRLNLV